MNPFFHLLFELCLCLWYSFLYLKNVNIHFHGIPLWSILVCNIPEFRRWKLWDQNFIPFDSGNIQIEESKKPGFTFSIDLRTKFVWSHRLYYKPLQFMFSKKYLVEKSWLRFQLGKKRFKFLAGKKSGPKIFVGN